jgi:hypothetical protein
VVPLILVHVCTRSCLILSNFERVVVPLILVHKLTKRQVHFLEGNLIICRAYILGASVLN